MANRKLYSWKLVGAFVALGLAGSTVAVQAGPWVLPDRIDHGRFASAPPPPPQPVDSDGDGYTDDQERNDPLLAHPPATWKTPGATGADPQKRDIFIEIDYIGPKRVWGIPYCGHKPRSSYINHMIDRFREHNYNVFVVVNDEIPHKENGKDRAKITQDDIFALKARYQTYPNYYYCLFADEAAPGLATGGMSHLNGISWFGSPGGRLKIVVLPGPEGLSSR